MAASLKGRRSLRTSDSLYYPLSPLSNREDSEPPKKIRKTISPCLKGKLALPSIFSHIKNLPKNGRQSFAPLPKGPWNLKNGNETITLESSSEIIDESVEEITNGFDWIRTPRSARIHHKVISPRRNIYTRKSDFAGLKSGTELNSSESKWKSAAYIKRVVQGESPLQTFLGANNGRSSPTTNQVSVSIPFNKISLLGGSKRRNVEAWLAESATQPVVTPPMSLSPRRVPTETPNSPSDLDPEVKDVLMAVYGENWKDKAFKKSKTEVKRSRHKVPVRVATDIKSKDDGRKLVSFSKRITEEPLTSNKLPRKRCARRKIFDDDSPLGVKLMNTSLDLGTQMIDASSPKKSFDVKTRSIENSTKKSTTKKRRKPSTSSVESPEQIHKTTEQAFTPKMTRSATVADVGAAKTPRRTFLASLSVSTPSTVCHPDARAYKISFAKKKDDLCARLFKLYNAEVFGNQLPENMLIKWNPKMRGTAGYCYSKRKKEKTGIVRSARIELAPRVVDRADRLRDTLVHELCHAAAWIVDGVMDGHGAVWSAWAQKALARFPELPPIRRCHNYQIATKFTYRCTVCGYSIHRQSRSIDTERKRCGHCLGVLELLFNKKKRGETEVPEFETTKTIRAPNNFALFVKENYKRLKEAQPDKKHGDVMKLLSQQYAVYKTVVTPAKKL